MIRQRDQTSAGYSLIELVVVLAIISLAASLAMVGLRRVPDSVRLEVAARNLASALRLARATAIGRHDEVLFTLDADQRTFETALNRRGHFDSDISVNLIVAAPERRGSVGGFRFYPNGSSTGGQVDLTLNSWQARVLVSWVTGEAQLEFVKSSSIRE